MSTLPSRTTRPMTPARRTVAGALIAVAVAVVYGELYAYASGSEDNPLRASFVIAGLSIATAIPLFRFGVPRWGTRAAVVLAGLALLGTVAYWAGVPAVLGVAAIVVAADAAEKAGRWVTATRVAAGVAGVALVLQLVASVIG
jgi:hypothetical protein